MADPDDGNSLKEFPQILHLFFFYLIHISGLKTPMHGVAANTCGGQRYQNYYESRYRHVRHLPPSNGELPMHYEENAIYYPDNCSSDNQRIFYYLGKTPGPVNVRPDSAGEDGQSQHRKS